jgi:hypothetical protein
MKVARLAPALALAFSLPALVLAEDAPPAAAEDSAQAAPAATAPEAAVPAATAPEAAAPEATAPDAAAPAAAAATPEVSEQAKDETLGPVGHDAQGRPGRIHVVQKGDTLWDISDAYLGTPWVWPSIWKDNAAQVANPHRIYPGERIWISPYEMRKVSDAEAAEMLARPAPQEAEPMPAAMADPDAPAPELHRATYRYSEIQTTGFVTLEELAGAAAILDGPPSRSLISDHSVVEIGLGQGEVAVGDQFDIFRPGDLVTDPSTGKAMGRVTEQLGWLEVTDVHDESATGVVRLSRSEIVKGDHVMPRRARSVEVPIGDRVDVHGVIAYVPNKRTQMGSGDVVYLNRGTHEGLVLGSPIEVYVDRAKAYDAVRKEKRALADRVIAKGIVVDAYDETAVAVVTHTTTELNRGFKFRGSDSIAP